MKSVICTYMHYKSSMPVSYIIAGKLGKLTRLEHLVNK